MAAGATTDDVRVGAGTAAVEVLLGAASTLLAVRNAGCEPATAKVASATAAVTTTRVGRRGRMSCELAQSGVFVWAVRLACTDVVLHGPQACTPTGPDVTPRIEEVARRPIGHRRWL